MWTPSYVYIRNLVLIVIDASVSWNVFGTDAFRLVMSLIKVGFVVAVFDSVALLVFGIIVLRDEAVLVGETAVMPAVF